MRYPPKVERLNHRLGLTVDFIELPLKDTHIAPALDPQNPLVIGTSALGSLLQNAQRPDWSLADQTATGRRPRAMETVARRVHASDRYPIYLPDGDFRRFLTQPTPFAAWVMTEDDRIVGHVALNDATSDPLMRAVDDLDNGRPARYIARLLVDLNARRAGCGRMLLEHARREAVAEGCLPVLDVVDIPTAAPAIALYRAAGWQEMARVSFDLGDMHLDEIVFVRSPA